MLLQLEIVKSFLPTTEKGEDTGNLENSLPLCLRKYLLSKLPDFEVAPYHSLAISHHWLILFLFPLPLVLFTQELPQALKLFSGYMLSN